ncbi:von Willebrand factor type A domain-containing protein [Arthrobacter alpinus]|uniref:von Willebrand factor type A domain-containing protein n=1 Tax=Arthrobacter alpinus TaxID=656366 RepID=A0A1H5G5Z3_9MICC|nr:VWA domain-containing protein [Arthrobacter alpinus]SEE10824.1 von Willebrand factor type A domain-containing protein [Arthrobacter alpinus]
MALTYWWLLPLGAVGLAVVVVFFWRRRADGARLIPVAHADRLTALPAYQKAVRQRRSWLLAALAAVVVLALSLMTAAARPVTERTSIPERLNRDIMLCLDVSGSMLDTDEAIVTVFSKLVGNFKGERIGLTIFDSSAVTVFPLTDDYEFVAEELKTAQKALGLDADSFEYFAGTYERPGSSLIGDGLASCVQGFPATGQDEQRSRSIILATDNMLAGKPIFTLAQASDLTAKAKIRVYALNPNDFGQSTLFGAAAENLKKAATTTGGAYYPLESESTVASIVDKVQATEAATLKGAPQKTVLDHPAWPLGLALASLLVLGVALWRLRR